MGACMSIVTDALSWDGSKVTLSLFTATREDREQRFSYETVECERVGVWPLDDELGILPGFNVVEYDFIFGTLPPELSSLIGSTLRDTMDQGAQTAWFGFEGSFHFADILKAEMSDQVYAFADSTGIHLAMTDQELGADSWKALLAAARERLLG